MMVLLFDFGAPEEAGFCEEGGFREEGGPPSGRGIAADRFVRLLNFREALETGGTVSSGGAMTPGFGVVSFFGMPRDTGLAAFFEVLDGGGVPSATAGGSPVGGLAERAKSSSAWRSFALGDGVEGWLFRALRRAANRSEKRPRLVRGARFAAADKGVPAVFVF